MIYVYVRVFHDLELLRCVLRCAIERQFKFPARINKVYCYGIVLKIYFLKQQHCTVSYNTLLVCSTAYCAVLYCTVQWVCSVRVPGCATIIP